MALESTTYINGLVTSNPAATDGLAAADDHLRLIKSTVKATFPNITGAVTSTHTELNKIDGYTGSATELNYAKTLYDTGVTNTEFDYLDGVSSNIQTQLAAITSAAIPASRTVTAGNALTGGGALTGDITINHQDTSTQASVNNSGLTFIQDVVLDTYGHVTGLTSAAAPADTSVGVGQTWQNLSSSRSINVWYHNNTGRTIFYYVQQDGGTQTVSVNSNGSNSVRVASANTGYWSGAAVPVPNGYYYSAGGNGNHYWSELR